MHHRLARAVLVLLLSIGGLAACGPSPTPGTAPAANKPLVDLPEQPSLTDAGRALIYDFEVGGEADYNRHPFPEVPPGPSGVTWAIGYDATAQAATVIALDWQDLGDRDAGRLAAMHPYRAAIAREHLPEVAMIRVPFRLASDVFDRVDLARTTEQCRRHFPGFETLAANAQAAMISLVFNRGAGTVGPARTEMLQLKDVDVPTADYRGMARRFRAMERIWRGTSLEHGMTRRREAEARLIETCL